jgi:antitoxin component YwqK of YwqJK toxin-antitoxin module
MKKIKNILLATILTFGAAAMAQESPEPKFEKEGNLIKGTFFYEDGSVKQEGTYKDGKLHGKWVAYDTNGKKQSMATYTEGNKTGKWFFWTADKLTEVDYDNNQIANVNTWKSDGTLADN